MTDNSDFGTFGRYEEAPINEMSPAMKDAYDFTKQLRGLVPGPHKIWLANPTPPRRSCQPVTISKKSPR